MAYFHRLALNISKTDFVTFSPKNKPLKSITLLMSRQAIAQKEYVKYLGVLIDSKLSFQFHITVVTKKVSRAIGLMYKLRHFVSKIIISSIYYSLIYPFLIYAIPIWGSADNIYIKPLLTLQKKIVRLLTFNDNYHNPSGSLAHTPPLFHELKILVIQDIFKIQTAKYVYKGLHDLNRFHLDNMFTYVPGIFNTAATRNQELLIPLSRTKRYDLKSIPNIGSHIWNNIPLVIRTKATTKLFTKALSIYLITCYNNN